MDNDWGLRIKEVRNRMGMTQTQFGNLIGLTQPSMAYIETGANKPSNKVCRFVELIGLCFDLVNAERIKKGKIHPRSYCKKIERFIYSKYSSMED